MSCKGCDKNKCITDIARGCCFCTSESNELGVEVCEGGHKLNVRDWLDDMPNINTEEVFEVRFKNTRKGFFLNNTGGTLSVGDVVAVEASPGHDIGIISLTGDLVYRQMKKVGFNPANAEFKKIYRKAKSYDIEKWQEAIGLEHSTMIKSRQIAADLNLNMKIGDVEYQGDRIKAIFYYIAEERVDFRELIKILADRFKIRVEMKQIGARQEAGRIGGIGSCGRELCCASWISNFVSVTTNSARVQEISLNPQKLAGQCGKLKCCLVYELDSYIDARREFPRINAPLEAMDGSYFLVKTDIFNRTMWFSSDPHSAISMTPISIDRVKEIIQINKRGKKIDKLVDDTAVVKVEAEPGYRNVVGEESITRFDSSKREKERNNKNRNNRSRPQRAIGERKEAVKPNDETPREANTKENHPPREGQPKENRPHRNNRYKNRKPQNEQ